jgi:hypothetical protein
LKIFCGPYIFAKLGRKKCKKKKKNQIISYAKMIVLLPGSGCGILDGVKFDIIRENE